MQAEITRIYHTPDDLAKTLKFHKRTIIRQFRDLDGVIRLVGPGGRETLRIPEETLQQWLTMRSRGWQQQARGSRGAR